MEYERKPVNIPGFEKWEVDTEGVIYTPEGEVQETFINPGGYEVVALKNKETKQNYLNGVHVIVARTFIPEHDSNQTQVNHKNGKKTKNNVDNLEWVTPKENNRHARETLGFNNSKENNPNARKIIGKDKKTGEIKYQFDSLMEAAEYFSTNGQNPRRTQLHIWRVLKHYPHRKSYRGCTWEYADDKIVNGPPKKDVLVE